MSEVTSLLSAARAVVDAAEEVLVPRGLYVRVPLEAIASLREAVDEEMVAGLAAVCPGCHAVAPERCAPGCIDDEMRRDAEEDFALGPRCGCGACADDACAPGCMAREGEP